MPVLAAMACVGEKGVMPSPSMPFLAMSEGCCNWAINMSQVSRGGSSPESLEGCTSANVLGSASQANPTWRVAGNRLPVERTVEGDEPPKTRSATS
ncbi:hypothetical protein CDAR_109201 [Caerostris darwini]|uniref:Uncharacterized protein n=1 Tax=Caerostris darwini TaxID=1538125 RepID=A0AAV4TRS8_9ARAC|nr:hypothetical protein CDAR_109201 [Caerostris darwini]